MNKKIFGFLICMLFIGTSIIPSIGGNIKTHDSESENDNSNFIYLSDDDLDQQNEESYNGSNSITLDNWTWEFEEGWNNISFTQEQLDAVDSPHPEDVFESISDYITWVFWYNESTGLWDFYDFNDSSGSLTSIIAGENYRVYVTQDCTLRIEKPEPPNVPDKPSGPTSGITGTSYPYYTTTTDPNGDNIRYGWDWDGDDTVDEWSNFVLSGSTDTRSHSWSTVGTFNVKVKAEDEHGVLSSWSPALNVIISPVENEPFYFLHLTDLHINGQNSNDVWGKALKQINEMNPLPAFIVITGDILDFGHPYYGTDPYTDLFNNIEPKLEGSRITSGNSGGWFLPPHHIPIYFCPGNHDSYNPPPTYTLSDFSTYEKDVANSYYHKSITINNKNIDIFSLNSGTDIGWPDFTPLGDGLKDDYGNEVTRFQQDNAASTGDIKIVLTHHPYIYGDNTDFIFNNNRLMFFNACNQYHVDLLCCGHVHSGDFICQLSGEGLSTNTFTPGGDIHIQIIGDNLWQSPGVPEDNPGQYRKIEVLSNGDIKIDAQKKFEAISKPYINPITQQLIEKLIQCFPFFEKILNQYYN